MRVVWSVPMRGASLSSSRGDLVRCRRLIVGLRGLGHEVTAIEDSAATLARLRVSLYRRALRGLLPRRTAVTLRDALRPWHGRRHARRVVAALRAQNADVLVETEVAFSDSGAWASGRSGLPLVLDDVSPPEEDLLGSALPGRKSQLLERQCGSAAAVVCSSRAIADRLQPLVPTRGRLVVIPNGVDLHAPSTDRRRTRSELGVTDRGVVVFAGSFQPWHEVESLPGALADEAGDLPWHLLLVGEGPGVAATLAQASTRGLSTRVTALGAVAHHRIPSILAAADLAVLPGSNAYGDPMKLGEYAAAGLPTVAPDLGPVRGRIEDGVTGTLFPPADRRALGRALAKYLQSAELRRRHGEAARRRLVEEDSWEHAAARLAIVLEDALARRRARLSAGLSPRSSG